MRYRTPPSSYWQDLTRRYRNAFPLTVIATAKGDVTNRRATGTFTAYAASN